MEAQAPARAIMELGEINGLTIESVEVVTSRKDVCSYTTNGGAKVSGVSSEESRVTILHFTNGTRCEIY